MSTNDQNATPEQKRPEGVSPKTDDEKSMAPPTFLPAGAKDESERPVVNPVSGGAI